MQLDSPRSPLGRVCTNTHTQKTDRQASTQAHTEDRQAHRQTDTQKTDKHIDTHTHKCTHTHTQREIHTHREDRQTDTYMQTHTHTAVTCAYNGFMDTCVQSQVSQQCCHRCKYLCALILLRDSLQSRQASSLDKL